MELTLRRVDYAQIGTTSKNCLRLLPNTESGQVQKVVVGSHSGILYCFQRKKQECVNVFKTLPKAKIECLSLGGALGTAQDKIFVAHENAVLGYNKKGKQFFTFEMNLTETITSMYIYGLDMFLCGTYSFNQYHDSKEMGSLLCTDKINAVICLPVVEGSWVGRGLTPVIACEDRTLKVISTSGVDLAVEYSVEVGGPPTVLHLFDNDGGKEGCEVIYGTRDGKIGLVDLPKANSIIKWEICSATGNSGVTALDCYDIMSDGILDLIVGRDDGAIEIYIYDQGSRPVLKQTIQCNESITALQCGRVSSPNFDEIVVCTYAGWLYGMTTEPASKEVSQDLTIKTDPALEEKVALLRQELESLRQKVALEREKYQESTQSETGISAVPVFDVNDRFSLNKDEAAYFLSLELQVAIDYVLIQCDVPLDLLDVERNSAVVSLTPCEPDSGNALLATYRCQANTTRLEIKIRSIEGQYGILRAYISPRIHPKSCQVRQYEIKPLSLHQRSHVYDQGRPQNTLRLNGSFSLAEVHSWMVLCLPELPEKTPVSETTQLHFLSTFTNTQLECSYSKGSAVFKSDSISTIAILKDVLSKETTKKKIRIDISCEIDDESVPHVLKLIHPTLEFQLGLAKKVHLIEALKELATHEGDTSFLSSDYLDILNNADQLEEQHRKQQAHLERIYGIITDLYIDKYKFKGQNVKQKVPKLLEIMDNYSLDSLLKFFMQN